MNSNQGTLSSEALAHKVAQGETSLEIADVVTLAWQRIDVVLSLLIGHRGVAGLFQRTLHITGIDYPWLAVCYKGISHEMNLDDLNKVLAKQSPMEAANAGALLLQTFYDLLCKLIGSTLTARLLDAVWSSSSGGSSAQDSIPSWPK